MKPIMNKGTLMGKLRVRAISEEDNTKRRKEA